MHLFLDRTFRLASIDKVRCKSRIVGQFPFFGGELLLLLSLGWRNKMLPGPLLGVCSCLLRACLARLSHRSLAALALYIAAAACCAAVAFAGTELPAVPQSFFCFPSGARQQDF